ncbi:MAG: His-Xaa-Ser system radical SAM maturase HxsB, partial [Deltaproteobacteria bacterium]|nr:His-Xaa-Ser system radical SAM maturase HxsB [Deltaproteobacteria bacterium]
MTPKIPSRLSGGLAPFRHASLGGRVLITNDVGEFLVLSPDDFQRFVEGRLDPVGPVHADLVARHFILGETTGDDLVQRYRDKNHFLFNGPYLHIAIVTLRCNEVCVYCHASRRRMDESSFDMSEETALRVVDMVFQSPSRQLIIEFQGGEPLANWGVVRRIIEAAEERNRAAGRSLGFSLVTNLSLMDEERLRYLVDHHVQICTSMDGPRDLHDANRHLRGGSAWESTVQWMERIDAAYREKGLDPALYHVESLMTTTRASLGRAREIVDEYVRLGRKALFLRPLNPFGFAKATFDRIGYTTDEFLVFYREALDHMIELNRKGVEILERNAAIFLTKMLTAGDPNYLDLRSPCGAGIGQIAYNFDGTLFTCDEGRMLGQMGDDVFRIGRLGESTYGDVMHHDTVKAVAVASCLDGLPGCMDCVYRPYCG